MRIFSSLYQRVMQWSRHQYATAWLALVSFTEAWCFLIPPDVMLAPMSLAKPDKAWFYAGLTTITSVLGGLVGYFIGNFAFQFIEPFLVSLHYIDTYYLVETWFEKWGVGVIFLAGFTPIPYKIFTIASGVLGIALLPFIIGSTIGRGARFFLLAALMRWGGERLETKLYTWIDNIAWAIILLAVLAYILVR